MTQEQRELIEAHEAEVASHTEAMPQWEEYGGDSFGLSYDPYAIQDESDDVAAFARFETEDEYPW